MAKVGTAIHFTNLSDEALGSDLPAVLGAITTHDIVLQRYYEAEGELRSFLTVIKARARKHSRDLRRYELTSRGIVVGEKLQQYQGIITAVPSQKRIE